MTQAMGKSLIGQVFGKLKVKEIATVGKRGALSWKCLCSCGQVVIANTKNLLNGNNKSCGCLKVERIVERNKALAKDLNGKVFGKWTVASLNEHRYSDGSLLWNVVCICGTKSSVPASRLLRGRSTQCDFCRAKSSVKRFCKNGHDTEVYGRDAYNSCKACIRERHLFKYYDISLKEYEAIYDLQEGKCYLCGVELIDHRKEDSQGKRSEVDHEHDIQPIRESVRGLLCGGKWGGCNYKFGKIDNSQWLIRAVAYLSNPPAKKIISEKVRRIK